MDPIENITAAKQYVAANASRVPKTSAEYDAPREGEARQDTALMVETRRETYRVSNPTGWARTDDDGDFHVLTHDGTALIVARDEFVAAVLLTGEAS